MATAKKEDGITIIEQTLIVKKQVVDQSLITPGEDHNFKLKPGTYQIDLTLNQIIVNLRIFNQTGKFTVVSANGNQLMTNFQSDEKTDFTIDYRVEGFHNWQPIQTLSPDEYTCTLTLID